MEKDNTPGTPPDCDSTDYRVYFAYGPDMAQSFMSRHCPTAVFLGTGRIGGYRLAVARPESPEGAEVRLRLVKGVGFTTRGAAYRVPSSDLERIRAAARAAESAAPDWVDSRSASASDADSGVTDFIALAAWTSPAAAGAEAGTLLEATGQAGQERALPPDYLDYLEGLEMQETGAESTVAVLPTLERSDVKVGLPIVRVRSSAGVRHRGLCAVTSRGRSCIAVAMVDPSVADGVCRLDQEARYALEIERSRSYGDTVSVRPLARSMLLAWRIWKPRTLTLPVEQAARRDAGKRICVLHPERLRMLGAQEGAWLVLRAAVSDGQTGEASERSIRLRAMAWTPRDEAFERRSGTELYPSLDAIHLDQEARLALFGALRDVDTLGQPVTVHADVGAMFWDRFMYYGIGVFGAVLALASVLMPLADEQGWRKSHVALAILVGALVFAGVGVVKDIRHRVRY